MTTKGESVVKYGEPLNLRPNAIPSKNATTLGVTPSAFAKCAVNLYTWLFTSILYIYVCIYSTRPICQFPVVQIKHCIRSMSQWLLWGPIIFSKAFFSLTSAMVFCRAFNALNNLSSNRFPSHFGEDINQND